MGGEIIDLGREVGEGGGDADPQPQESLRPELRCDVSGAAPQGGGGLVGGG